MLSWLNFSPSELIYLLLFVTRCLVAQVMRTENPLLKKMSCTIPLLRNLLVASSLSGKCTGTYC